ncbi:MAG: endo alpha-1,4 polygalactosaminidase [Kofleriaceae bacterium]|nr:endo alpha-1,4 polygalactosaminidase [Kofleriaceae bacterium]
MRSVSLGLVVLGLAAGCDNGKMHLHPEAGTRPDSPTVTWWRPMPGTVKNWDVQLAAPFDVSAARTMYDLDLWAVTPATTIDHGDGAPVTVPAGPLAGTIEMLKARSPKPVVICHVLTGAVRLTDPDASKFPGFEASPPDDPDPPAANSVIGWSTPAGEGERFLDIRASSRAQFQALIWKRLDLAKQIGCDGVEADRNDMIMLQPGWSLTPSDQTSWYVEVAMQAHQRGLSVGLKNGNTVPGQIDELVSSFDWMMVERCGEFEDCDSARPMLNLQRAVLAIDYQSDIDGNPRNEAVDCARQVDSMIDDGLVKDNALSSAYRHQCVP